MSVHPLPCPILHIRSFIHTEHSVYTSYEAFSLRTPSTSSPGLISNSLVLHGEKSLLVSSVVSADVSKEYFVPIIKDAASRYFGSSTIVLFSLPACSSICISYLGDTSMLPQPPRKSLDFCTAGRGEQGGQVSSYLSSTRPEELVEPRNPCSLNLENRSPSQPTTVRRTLGLARISQGFFALVVLLLLCHTGASSAPWDNTGLVSPGTFDAVFMLRAGS